MLPPRGGCQLIVAFTNIHQYFFFYSAFAKVNNKKKIKIRTNVKYFIHNKSYQIRPVTVQL